LETGQGQKTVGKKKKKTHMAAEVHRQKGSQSEEKHAHGRPQRPAAGCPEREQAPATGGRRIVVIIVDFAVICTCTCVFTCTSTCIPTGTQSMRFVSSERCLQPPPEAVIMGGGGGGGSCRRSGGVDCAGRGLLAEDNIAHNVSSSWAVEHAEPNLYQEAVFLFISRVAKSVPGCRPVVTSWRDLTRRVVVDGGL